MSNSPAGHVSWPDSFDDAPFSSPDRRKHARKKLVATTATLLDSVSECSATVIDLSEGGLGVRSEARLAESATCRLQLPLPGSNQVIDAACEVAWSQAPNVGFRFSILSERSQQQIKQWMHLLELAEQEAAELEALPQAIAVDDIEPEAAVVPPSPEAAAPVAAETLEAYGHEDLIAFVTRARDATEADGAAVALNTGDGMICRASLGTAPDVGVRIRFDQGLSGECLRTGEIVTCYDMESDGRVDPAVCRRLNMRSAVIVPIGRHETPMGLLEVFFSRPHAFAEAQVYALQELASSLLLRHTPAPAVPAEEPAASGTSLPQLTSFRQRETEPGFVICDVCGRENPDRNRVCEKCDVPLPSALRYVDLNSPADLEDSGGRNQAIRFEFPEPKRRHSKKLLLLMLVTLLAATWQARGKISTEVPPPPPPPPKPAPVIVKQQAPPVVAEKPAESEQEDDAMVRIIHPLAKAKGQIGQPKAASKSDASAAPAKKPSPARPLTVPQTAPNGQLSSVSPPPISDHEIMLPLNDQDVASAVAAPAAIPARPRPAGFWKRVGKKLFRADFKPAATSQKK